MHRPYSLTSSRSLKKVPVQLMKEVRWVRRLRVGDSTAWLQLIEHWSPRLYSYVLYNVETEADAQAVVEASFGEMVRTVVNSLHIANLTVLCFSLAYQQVLRYRQAKGPFFSPPHPQLLSNAGSPDPQLASFWQNFQKFQPECQQILLLHYLCGVKLVDISQIVGEREEVLRRVLHHAKRYLLLT